MFNSGFIAYLGQQHPRSSLEIQEELNDLKTKSDALETAILASLDTFRTLLNQRTL